MKDMEKGYKLCPVCGTKNEASALYCKKCFYDLSTVPVIKETKSLKLISDKFTIPIVKDTVIGRAATGKDYLKDKAISRKHLKIFWKNGKPYVQDLNSTNGSYINDQKMIPMEAYPLSNNDRINLANKIEFTVKIADVGEETVREAILEEKTYREEDYEKVDKTVFQPVSNLAKPFPEEYQEIKGYKIERHIASGGESDTYLVKKNNKEYVLKIYKADIVPDSKIIENIKNISHKYKDYLVELIEFWKDDNKFYEVYQFYKNGNLLEFLKSNKNKFNFRNKKILFNFVSQLHNSLRILHEHGIIHRDLKPSNILIKDDFKFVLSDFGIARDIKSATVHTKTFKGSYKYSAPETLSNQYTEKSDYWSLGIIIYELYFGKNPFENKDINAVFSELLSNEPFPIPSENVDAEVLTLLKGLLEKSPEKRWGSKEVDEFLKKLEKPKEETTEEKKWEEYGFTSVEKKEWSEKGFSSIEAYKWKKAGFSLEDAIFLKNLYIEPEEAEYAKKEGLTLSEMKTLKTKVRYLLQESKAHYGAVKSVDYSLKESLLASGGNDYALKLWDEIATQTYAIFENHADYVEDVAFSPNGKIIASASRDKTIKLWDVENKEYIDTLEGHNNYVQSISFSPNGKILASGGWDTKVIIWDVEKKTIIDTFHENLSHVLSLSFSNNGKYLASGSEDGTVYVWDMQKKDVIFKTESNYPVGIFVSFHPFKEEILAYTGEDGHIFIWDIENKRLIKRLEDDIKKTSISFDKSGNLIAAGGEDGSIILWDLSSRYSYTILRKNLEDIYIEEDSTKVIRNGNQLEIWDKFKNKRVGIIKLISFAINSVAFSKDNRYLACGTNDGNIQIWESYLPATIQAIFQSGFTIQEYFKWLEKGYDIYEAKNWKMRGFDVDTATKWKNKGFLPERAKEWLDYGFSLEDAIKWKILGFLPHEAANWFREGLTPEQIDDWLAEGFSLIEAKEWIANGFDIEDAKIWRNDDIPPKKAKIYRRFGFIGRILAKYF